MPALPHLPAHPRSPWLEGDRRRPGTGADAERTPPPAPDDLAADVVVVGAGIAGLTTAWLLARDGARVTVIDAQGVGRGVTGVTTAKATALHGAAYHELEQQHGQTRTAAYAAAQQAALALLHLEVPRLAPDARWEPRPAATYTWDPAHVATIEAEQQAAARAGLATALTDDPDAIDTPFPVLAAVRLGHQAQFDPLPWLRALAGEVERHGGQVVEGVRATGLGGLGGGPVETSIGPIPADRVVLATGIPFADRALFFAREEPRRSYAMALRVEGHLPEVMSINVGTPTRSLRTVRDPADGRELLLVGGEGHLTGHHGDTWACYEALAAWTADHWTTEAVAYRWSAQDYVTIDGLPFIGRLWPPSGNRVLVATGFRKWGMTNGTAAGMALADLVAGRDNEWAKPLDPQRISGPRGVARFARINLEVGARFVRDRVTPAPNGGAADGDGAATDGDGDGAAADGNGDGSATVPRASELPEGAVVRRGVEKVGICREGGEARAFSLTCPHLAGVLQWNQAERSWDCPLHGSRFTCDGRLLQGPAVDDLTERPVPTPAPPRSR